MGTKLGIFGANVGVGVFVNFVPFPVTLPVMLGPRDRKFGLGLGYVAVILSVLSISTGLSHHYSSPVLISGDVIFG